MCPVVCALAATHLLSHSGCLALSYTIQVDLGEDLATKGSRIVNEVFAAVRIECVTTAAVVGAKHTFLQHRRVGASSF